MTETAVWMSFAVSYGFMIAYVVSLVRRDRRLRADRREE